MFPLRGIVFFVQVVLCSCSCENLKNWEIDLIAFFFEIYYFLSIAGGSSDQKKNEIRNEVIVVNNDIKGQKTEMCFSVQ